MNIGNNWALIDDPLLGIVTLDGSHTKFIHTRPKLTTIPIRRRCIIYSE